MMHHICAQAQVLAKHGPELTEEALDDMPYAGAPRPAAPRCAAWPSRTVAQDNPCLPAGRPACRLPGVLFVSCPASAGLVPTVRN